MNLKHGENHKGNPAVEYVAWTAMKQRCFNPNTSGYENYGGRGITVCEGWKDDYTQFLKDMGRKPGPNYSLDRIDPNGDYTAENCRWADKTTQSRNVRKSRTNTTGVKGVQRGKGKFRATIFFHGKLRYLGSFDTIQEAAAARGCAEQFFWGVTE